MKATKCPCCGATIPVQVYESSGKCEYCGSPLVSETRPNPNQQIQEKQSTSTSLNKKEYIPPRPVLNVGVAIFLLFLYVVFGIIYIACVKAKQVEWDKKYGK